MLINQPIQHITKETTHQLVFLLRLCVLLLILYSGSDTYVVPLEGPCRLQVYWAGVSSL